MLRSVAPAVDTTVRVARIAGGLLARHGGSSRDTVDALVVATAIRLGGGVIPTSNPGDLRVLASDHPNVKIVAL